ncbi:hypothetical protein WL1483_853 [Aeromonas schubertii]|uniref:Transposase n=1 Tax=Aeromonas schubertii TaxID=652 RepID=A0A0S2SEZ7_9GAMM|nr:hypothetical protein WL1483_853 [Aeromonas schubertii]
MASGRRQGLKARLRTHSFARLGAAQQFIWEVQLLLKKACIQRVIDHGIEVHKPGLK